MLGIILLHPLFRGLREKKGLKDGSKKQLAKQNGSPVQEEFDDSTPNVVGEKDAMDTPDEGKGKKNIRRIVADEVASPLHKIQTLVAGAKGKEVFDRQEMNSISQEGEAEAMDVFNFNWEELPNVLGLAKEGTISLKLSNRSQKFSHNQSQKSLQRLSPYLDCSNGISMSLI